MVGGDTLEMVYELGGNFTDSQARTPPTNVSYYDYDYRTKIFSFILTLEGDPESKMGSRLNKNPPNIFIVIPSKMIKTPRGKTTGKEITIRDDPSEIFVKHIDVEYDSEIPYRAVVKFTVHLQDVTGDVNCIPESIMLQIDCPSEVREKKKWDSIGRVVKVRHGSSDHYTCHDANAVPPPVYQEW
jgi:hypothetical protein